MLSQPRIEARALDLDAVDSFPSLGSRSASGWRAFVRGAVAELRVVGVPVPGLRLEITGTVPRGAGLASSGALAVALTMAIIELSGAPGPAGTELAKLCSRIENHWVGARAGLLDQLSSIHGQAGHALQIDFRTLEIRPVRLELEGHRLVTLDSGERRAHAQSGYNQRRAECARACELMGISSLREATESAARELPVPLDRRALHVIGANARVVAALDALQGRELHDLGRLLDSAHASLRDLYEVSTPAVETAVNRLKAAGAIGARVMGGGFGGVVLGLLPPDAEAPPGAVTVGPGAGARVLDGAK